MRRFAEDRNEKPSRHWRIVNEIPTVTWMASGRWTFELDGRELTVSTQRRGPTTWRVRVESPQPDAGKAGNALGEDAARIDIDEIKARPIRVGNAGYGCPVLCRQRAMQQVKA